MIPTTTSNRQPRFLLDTHVWIWLEDGRVSELPAEIADAMVQVRHQGGLCVSAISVFEVGILVTKGRIALSKPLDAWLERAVAHPGVRVLPVTAEVALHAVSLPGEFHRDPADQMIVATARTTASTLLTRDAKILSYARQGHLRVLHV